MTSELLELIIEFFKTSKSEDLELLNLTIQDRQDLEKNFYFRAKKGDNLIVMTITNSYTFKCHYNDITVAELTLINEDFIKVITLLTINLLIYFVSNY